MMKLHHTFLVPFSTLTFTYYMYLVIYLNFKFVDLGLKIDNPKVPLL